MDTFQNQTLDWSLRVAKIYYVLNFVATDITNMYW
jgi:hypothetical protein